MTLNDLPQGSSGIESRKEQEISFSASHLLTKLTAYKDTNQLSSLAFRKGQPEEIKQRQKFLLTEKPRVASQGYTIELGVYKNSPDGVDGKWGKNTETSTSNYLKRLFDNKHPERRAFVSTKLNARVQIESNKIHLTEGEGASITAAKQRVEENKAKKRELEILKEQKIELQNSLTPDQLALVSPEIDGKINQLETSMAQSMELERNSSLEFERTENLFFVVTLDGNKVVYNEQAEQLHVSARNAIRSISNIEAKNEKNEVVSLEKFIDDIVESNKQKIRSGATYQQTINNLQEQGLSREEAVKIVEEQTTKAATTLAIREFSYKIEQGETYGFSAATLTQIKNNEELKIFNELFEKVIIDWYEDITDLNHLDRELPLPLDPYFETISKVTVYENPTIENYLFDTPAKTPTPIFDDNERGETTNEHIRKKILGINETNEENKENEPDEKASEEFCQELNIFSSKRLRQLLLYQHFRTVKNILQQTDMTGGTLQTACNFSLAEINIDNNTHSLDIPFTYQHLSTKLTIQGPNGDITFPTLLDRFSGKTSFPRLATSTPQAVLEQELLQTAKLTNEELLLCTSRREVEEMITAKMSQKLLEIPTSSTSPEEIAQKIEHEALLANLRGYMDHTHNTKSPLEKTKNVPRTNEQFLTLIPHLVTNNQGHLPLTLEQTRTINKQLTNANMHHLFAQLTKQPGDFEEFCIQGNLLDPTPRPTKIVSFFTLLEQIASSSEKTQQEASIIKLNQLTAQVTPPLIGTQENGSLYIYQNKQLIKRA